MEGGLHGEDYHIEPSDKTLTGTTREIGQYEQMTPTNYTRTGESIDYVSERYIAGDYLGMIDIDLEIIPFDEEHDWPLTWKIWGEDNENIYLISDLPTKAKLKFSGIDAGSRDILTISGAVDTLDWCCNAYYGTTKYQRAKTRSLRVEDLEYITENEVLHQGEYGTSPYILSTKGQNIPITWGYLGIGKMTENMSKRITGRIRSNLKQVNTTVTEINPIITAMNYTFRPNDEGLINPKYYKLIVRDPENTGDPMWYWLASRYISGENTADGPKLYYGLLNIQGNKLSTGQLYSSAGEPSTVSGCGIRPVVIIPKESCIISNGGDNGETYHIQPRG